MGPLLNLGNDKNAVCDLLQEYTISCTPCPDEKEFCVQVVGKIGKADLIPDLIISE